MHITNVITHSFASSSIGNLLQFYIFKYLSFLRLWRKWKAIQSQNYTISKWRGGGSIKKKCIATLSYSTTCTYHINSRYCSYVPYIPASLQCLCIIVCLYVYLQSQSEVAALCVPHQAGRHGAAGPPAPLQVTHGVLVQVTCCHHRTGGSQTSRRELQTALGCQETGQTGDKQRKHLRGRICFSYATLHLILMTLSFKAPYN